MERSINQMRAVNLILHQNVPKIIINTKIIGLRMSCCVFSSLNLILVKSTSKRKKKKQQLCVAYFFKVRLEKIASNIFKS